MDALTPKQLVDGAIKRSLRETNFMSMKMSFANDMLRNKETEAFMKEPMVTAIIMAASEEDVKKSGGWEGFVKDFAFYKGLPTDEC